MKLTKKLRDRCWRAITDFAAEFVGAPNKSLHELADALAACEVEEEPVMYEDARVALVEAGWSNIDSSLTLDGYVGRWHRADRLLILTTHQDTKVVIRTRYCPPDLLDGRLAALDEEAKP